MVQDLTRRPDWRARLHAEIEAHRGKAFVWGAHDCALGLAAGAVAAITGADLRGDWGSRYSTAIGARRALTRAGFASLGEAVAAVLPECHPAMARVGDIALIEEGAIGALAVCNGGALLVLTEGGLGIRERSAAVRAWRVG